MLALTDKIQESISVARESFNIDEFPGNLFLLFEKEDYADKYRLLLFKENIDRLSGFIGYGDKNLTVICINYQRPIGHQNFTLAHELGHWFLHRGRNISDTDKNLYIQDSIEGEANNFASGLLYPKKLISQDYHDICEKGLLDTSKRKELAVYINELCQKYCLSFKMVLSKILYENYQANLYKNIQKEIEKSLGMKISKCFDKDFYVPNHNLSEYQQRKNPYIVLEERLDKLVELKKIGKATADSIKLRNGIEIDS